MGRKSGSQQLLQQIHALFRFAAYVMSGYICSYAQSRMLRNGQRLLHHCAGSLVAQKVGTMTIPAALAHLQQAAGSSETALTILANTVAGNTGKSVKRKAAEALLQSRSLTAAGHSGFAESPVKRRHLNPPIIVRASTATADSCNNQEYQEDPAERWCDFNVCVPHLEWSRVVLSPALETDSHLLPHTARMPTYTLTDDVTVYVVEKAPHVPEALNMLRDSMDDSLVSIDLEWKPDYVRDTSKVALMQLSSSRCCLLIRLCKIGQQLPDALQSFFRDPQFTFLGFAWDSSDEKKMQRTFGLGKDVFTNFLDLQDVAQHLGYHNAGLAKLTKQVLGCAGYKSKRVSMSNWEARKLTPAQIQYAALDALVTGQVFRGLRLWRSAPSACSSCHHVMGEAVPLSNLSCSHHLCRGRTFASLSSLAAHASHSRHSVSVQNCLECGRCSVQLPSSA